ncbi:hypothetical protein SAMN05421813_102239 [Daejeonella rubra]|uniref:Uncharacterized protein n=1 Tax=Daejeonella rubra TaxID=990371 RepID=A0A1G9N546_9SPHI|nr:hypothetical protein SAMN05421813_102239 [Daejeonella rubra]
MLFDHSCAGINSYNNTETTSGRFYILPTEYPLIFQKVSIFIPMEIFVLPMEIGKATMSITNFIHKAS